VSSQLISSLPVIKTRLPVIEALLPMFPIRCLNVATCMMFKQGGATRSNAN